jgi:GNAT superfamily N-acetyltransferase
MRSYRDGDFIRIRDFLVDTYGHFQRSYNWTIERWNFCVSVARMMNGVSMETWTGRIGIWEEDDEILGVVHTEGENRGEAFFEFRHELLPKELLEEMFGFCEAEFGTVQDNERIIDLRLPAGEIRLEEMAAERGFTRQPWVSPEGVMVLDDLLPDALPTGFTFADGTEVTAEEKAEAHAKAFGYVGEAPYPDRAKAGFRKMAEMPDYRAEFDVHVRAPNGEVASFATMWYDATNQIGILEPVGTLPDYRKQGLGRAAIYRGANLIRERGAGRALVGSDQAFYRRLGFEPRTKYTIWRKTFDAP